MMYGIIAELDRSAAASGTSGKQIQEKATLFKISASGMVNVSRFGGERKNLPHARRFTSPQRLAESFSTWLEATRVAGRRRSKRSANSDADSRRPSNRWRASTIDSKSAA